MPARKRTVLIGLLGQRLAQGAGPQRWERWRPSVALGQQDDLRIDRFELLYEGREGVRAVYDQVVEDLGTVSPETELRGHELQLGDAWDFEHVFGVLHDFARTYPFDTEQEDYLVHITTGTHVAQICLFLLTETRHLPARLIQTSPPRRRED